MKLKLHFQNHIEQLHNQEKGGIFTIFDLVKKFPNHVQLEARKYMFKDAIEKVWFLKKRPPEFYEKILPLLSYENSDFKEGDEIL